ncbi:hypothetical protein [Rhodococcus sp. OK302]|uniref:hypothetical protein n=1 Tax=Rhodococcus sp. OK302 TaxID=1882769 RepID=UPI000B93D388|nr:hypothetical protein [Rhodococcus sp. OK302]
MKIIQNKPSFSVLEIIFSLIGPALIVITILFPIEQMSIGTFQLELPDGVANGLLTAIGILVTLLSISTLLKKKAAQSHGAKIVISDDSVTFTRVRGYKGVLATLPFDQMTKISITTGDENTIKITAPAAKPSKVTFDADDMKNHEEFAVLVDALKQKADNASFKAVTV